MTMMLAAWAVLSGRAQSVGQYRPLFNGKDLKGWVNLNTAPETWSVKDGILRCTGQPVGVLRTGQEYENFLLHVEWMHLEEGGNSGMFLWSSGRPDEKTRLPDGVEVQMLETGWVKQNTRDGVAPPWAYVHGELFGVGGVTLVAENPRGARSMSRENRCLPRGFWNAYDIVAVDGVIKLSVNGKFVNGVRDVSRRRGYILLESEGAPVQFRDIRILELP